MATSREQALLAEIAPVDGILPVARDVQLVGLEGDLPDAVRPAELLCLRRLPFWEGGGAGRHSGAGGAEGGACGVQKERRVDAAGEGDRNAPLLLQVGKEVLPLFVCRLFVHKADLLFDLLLRGEGGTCLLCQAVSFRHQKKAPVGVTTMSVCMSSGRQGIASCTCSV